MRRKYINSIDKKCVDQILGGKKCNQSDACRSNLGLSFRSKECKCDANNYWNDKNCVPS